MKKTMLRSLIVGLFAVASLNASAQMNWDYLLYYFLDEQDNLNGFYVSGGWKDANTTYYYEEDAFRYDNYDHTGQLVRVVWGPNFNLSGIYEGDEIGVVGCNETGASISWQGTNAVYQTLVEVDSEGKFGYYITTGSTAGVRTFGPVIYWPQWFENIPYLGFEPDWNVVWGWSPWIH